MPWDTTGCCSSMQREILNNYKLKTMKIINNLLTHQQGLYMLEICSPQLYSHLFDFYQNNCISRAIQIIYNGIGAGGIMDQLRSALRRCIVEPY